MNVYDVRGEFQGSFKAKRSATGLLVHHAAALVGLHKNVSFPHWDALYIVLSVNKSTRAACNSRVRDRNLSERRDMPSIPRSPGIYQWLCIPNGKVYVGSSTNCYSRFCEHRADLRKGVHVNRYLQNAWNKYGESAFAFSVIEPVLFVEDLLTREQYWIDRLQSFDDKRGYNIYRFAGSGLGHPVSQETRNKISAALRGKDIGQQGREVLKARLTGKPVHPALLQGSIEYHSKSYLVISPSGEEYRIKNMRAFCRTHNLDSTGMTKVATGKIRHHRGWTCRELQEHES